MGRFCGRGWGEIVVGGYFGYNNEFIYIITPLPVTMLVKIKEHAKRRGYVKLYD